MNLSPTLLLSTKNDQQSTMKASVPARMMWTIPILFLIDWYGALVFGDGSSSSSGGDDVRTNATSSSTGLEQQATDAVMTCSSSSLSQSETCTSSGAEKSLLTSSSSSLLPPMGDAPELECGLWLAPSSIPNAGMGMWAGRNFAKDEHLQDSGDVAIAIVDIRLHMDDYETQFLPDEYTWQSLDYDPDFQIGREAYSSADFLSPGFGAAANCFLPLQNVEEEYPVWDNVGLHRSRDPGAGAFSQYGNRVSTATRDISAGEELCVSYGDAWFRERTFLGPIPLTEDLARANSLTQSFSKLYRNLSSTSPHVRSTLKEVWRQFIQEDSVYTDSRVLGAFNHSDPNEFEQLREGKDIADIRTNQSMRSLDWLRQNGVCADHIGARPSTLPQAGHGAFARRRLPNGTVATSLPMIHIPDGSIFSMYPVELSASGAVVHRDADPVGYQLLLNYCFGHEATSLLLCPYGPHGAYFNHNKSLANARLVWSDPARSNHQPEYLDLPIEALTEGGRSAKLSMDVVTTRDLEEGEELFLDYGTAWEEAWERHVENWTPVEGSESFVYAVARNRDVESPLPTLSELEAANPHPDLELMCSAVFLDHVDWMAHYPDRLAEYLEHETPFGETNTYKCDITSRRTDEHGNYRYSVVAWTWDPEKDPHAQDLAEYATVADLPRQAFAYFQKPYSSDTFLPKVFRHPIGIPDDLLPQVWRNR